MAEPFAAVRLNVLWTVDSKSVGNVNMCTSVGSVKTIFRAKSGEICTVLTPTVPLGNTLSS